MARRRDRDLGPPPGTASAGPSYQAGPPFWVVRLSIGLVVGLFSVVLLGATRTGRYPIAFLLFWGALSAILVVFYGLSWGAKLRIEGDTLYWRAPLRFRHVSIRELEAVRLGPRRVAVFRTHDRRAFVVSTPGSTSQDQFRTFVAELRKRRPSLHVYEQ